MKPKRRKKQGKTEARENLNPVFRAVLGVGFILFLLYSNLLMREFIQSGSARGQSLLFAVRDIFSPANFVIGVVSALMVYLIYEYFQPF
jgi:hypothetical protein